MYFGLRALAPALFALSLSNTAYGATFDSSLFTAGEASFADAVVSADLGLGTRIPDGAPNGDPKEALGAPSPGKEAYTLGVGGNVVLQFTDNSLTGSGDAAADLKVFEVGKQIEDTFVEISADGSDFISVGKISGNTSAIDIDAFLTVLGIDPLTRFSFVRLTDDPTQGTAGKNQDFAGADIDAVGAISSGAPVVFPTPVPLPAGGLLLIAGIAALGFVRRRTTA